MAQKNPKQGVEQAAEQAVEQITHYNILLPKETF